jgi:hypothetical protein
VNAARANLAVKLTRGRPEARGGGGRPHPPAALAARGPPLRGTDNPAQLTARDVRRTKAHRSAFLRMHVE